uniref:Uncharacterized protein n=1 Tax=Globodera rostochiensis TaxID=31243 RepID=A0A914HQB3_GLORO
MMKPPKKMPTELILELVSFVPLSLKWGQTRVSVAFDRFLLQRIGGWLSQMQTLVSLCQKTFISVLKSVRAVPVIDSIGFNSMKCEAGRLYTALASISRDSRSFTEGASLSSFSLDINSPQYVDDVIWHCRDLVKNCYNSPGATKSDLEELAQWLSILKQGLDLMYSLDIGGYVYKKKAQKAVDEG